jgi:inward rectifier potassium channel
MATPIQPTNADFDVVGLGRTPFADAYHAYLRAPLWLSIGMIVGAYLAMNVFFAAIFWLIGGVAESSGSFADAFDFSVQTMATIGYGVMHPVTPLANAVVTCEAIVGMLVSAISTGLVFAKISIPAARIAFSERVGIAPMDGVPTLQFRLGNQRSNMVMHTQLGLVLVRTEKTAEGMTFYRMYDLPLVRTHAPTLTRTWTAMHRITPESPLWGATPESLRQSETELQVTVVGTDDTTLLPVHAGIRYLNHEVVFGMRPADVLSELPDGRLRVDLRNFHALTPVGPVVWDREEWDEE